MNQKNAYNLLNKVTTDYNKMAGKFSSTRKFLSNDLLELEKYIENGDKILDLGCGNGRFFELASVKEIDYLGADVSKELVKIAREKYPNGKFDLLQDPILLRYQPKTFNKVFMLAAFHHIPTVELRLKYLQEIKRVLKDNGELIITVWNLIEKEEIRQKISCNKFLSFFGLLKLDRNDIFLDFKEGKRLIAKRYIHCFDSKELEELLKMAGFSILESKIQRRGKSGRFSNILVVANSN